jgi:hypothetical protein
MAWLENSIALIHSMHKLGTRIQFNDPTKTHSNSRNMGAIMDDTNLMLSDFGITSQWSPKVMLEKANQLSKRWTDQFHLFGITLRCASSDHGNGIMIHP